MLQRELRQRIGTIYKQRIIFVISRRAQKQEIRSRKRKRKRYTQKSATETGEFAEGGGGCPLSRLGDPVPPSADLHTGHF